jgi:hypothetical protein
MTTMMTRSLAADNSGSMPMHRLTDWQRLALMPLHGQSMHRHPLLLTSV